jgi:hypothetical protein
LFVRALLACGAMAARHMPVRRVPTQKSPAVSEATSIFILIFDCEKLLVAQYVEEREFGVTDGARTHDNRNHNPGLYQLSYGHHRDSKRQLKSISLFN